ncbi:MAG: DUF167 domain-containing protein [Kiritimatiellae bacterium]|nr:DUF167 domain-containing protein [Kiritimatiellia bacterium]
MRVAPRASKTEVAGLRDGALKIRLNAPPVDGKANAALVEFVADALGAPKRAVSIVSGETSRDKTVAVRGVSAARAAAAFDVPPEGGE